MTSLNDSVPIVSYRCANCDRESDRIAADKKCADCKGDLIEESGQPLDATLDKIVEKSVENCSICLEGMADEWRRLRCGHGFHEKCISSWFTTMRTCPLCRKLVKSPTLSGVHLSAVNHNQDYTVNYARFIIAIPEYQTSTRIGRLMAGSDTSAAETRVEPNN